MSPKLVSQPVQINLSGLDNRYKRADLHLYGVDHSGPSYEGRVFLNNSDADEKTVLTPESGYAGSFYVFGHGDCYGDEGHCETPEKRQPYDLRIPHPLLSEEHHVTITDSLRRIEQAGATELTVTVVPVVRDAPDYIRAELVRDPLKVERVSIVTYD